MKIRRSFAVSLLLLASTTGIACASVASAASADAFVSPDSVNSITVQQPVQGQFGDVGGTTSAHAEQSAAHAAATADCVGPVSFCTPFFGS